MKRYIRSSRAEFTSGGVTYTGYDPNDNKKIIINTAKSPQVVYINYQRDTYMQSIYGYVYNYDWDPYRGKAIPIDGFSAQIGFGNYNNNKYFDTQEAAIEYVVNKCMRKYNVSPNNIIMR